MPWNGILRETEKEEDQKHLEKRSIARGTEDGKDLGRNEELQKTGRNVKQQ